MKIHTIALLDAEGRAYNRVVVNEETLLNLTVPWVLFEGDAATCDDGDLYNFKTGEFYTPDEELARRKEEYIKNEEAIADVLAAEAAEYAAKLAVTEAAKAEQDARIAGIKVEKDIKT